MKRWMVGVAGMVLAASAFASSPVGMVHPGIQGEPSPEMHLRMERGEAGSGRMMSFEAHKKQVQARIVQMRQGLDQTAKCVDGAKDREALRACLPKPPKKGPWGERRDRMNHEMEREHGDRDGVRSR